MSPAAQERAPCPDSSPSRSGSPTSSSTNGDAIAETVSRRARFESCFANRVTRGDGHAEGSDSGRGDRAAIAAAAIGGRSEGAAAATGSCAKANLNLVKDGQLSIGTDNPAFPPWFAGGETKGRPWKINDPAKGKGFESAVAYAVAKRLGFTKNQVVWVYTPFNKAIAPGKKSYDFDINQISYTPERAKVLAFSASYYNVNQSIVGLKGKPTRRCARSQD